jgi:hypothetical protein
MACYVCGRKEELRIKKIDKAKEKAKALFEETGLPVVVVKDGYLYKAVKESEANGREIIEYFI